MLSEKCYKDFRFAMVLWIIYFCYALCAALIFQKIVLPLVPSMHAGGGLMVNDSVYFDRIAMEVSERISQFGWGEWSIYPATGAQGNVAVLAALYATFGHDPTLIVPVNAALHAWGGLMIFLLLKQLSGSSPAGTYAGVVAASLFVIFPSALTWYGQNHKDGYMIAGLLLVLWTWAVALRGTHIFRKWLGLLLIHTAGLTLIASVRPYMMTLLFIASSSAVIVFSAIAVFSGRNRRVTVGAIVFFFVAVVSFAFGNKVTSSFLFATTGDLYTDRQSASDWQWTNSAILPNKVNRYLETAARTRAGLIEYGKSVNAKSMIGADIAPQSPNEIFADLPRALQTALLAPFPPAWIEIRSASRLVASIETLVFYLALPGVILLLIYRFIPETLLTILSALFLLTIYGFIQANLGSLYRLRFGPWFLILSLGVLGWFTWLQRTGRLNRLLHAFEEKQNLSEDRRHLKNVLSQRKRTIGTSLVVIALTLLTFVGFFLRDILMAREFGLGAPLDSFFIALLLPMFIVTVLCIPLGTAFIPVYLEAKANLPTHKLHTLVPLTSLWVNIVLGACCIVLLLSGPGLLPLLYYDGLLFDMQRVWTLFYLAIPVLFFSGSVILGNSVLNANGNAMYAAAVQLIVPLLAVAALLMFGAEIGVEAAMMGMVAGQLLNLLLVEMRLKRFQVSLLPRFSHGLELYLTGLMGHYAPLVVSAFFVSAVVPVATILAMSMPEGSVSALNLGTKLVLFVTGLVGTTITSVLLPYFASLVARNQMGAARRELSFFLLLSTFVSLPISVVLFLWANEIATLLFASKSVDAESIELIAHIMRYSIVQLPFLASNTLLLRFCTATKHIVTIIMIALVGLAANITVSLLLMQHMGVAGIALGGSVSVILSTALLVLALLRFGHIALLDVVIVSLGWLLFLTLLVSFYFGSTPSAASVMTAFTILMVVYLSTPSRFGFWRKRAQGLTNE